MAKVALLIGVSDYHAGFKSLPAATRDVEAVLQVLRHPKIGGFAPTDITILHNPDPQRMREALVTLFKDRQKNDLLLLYFSGHGVTNDQGIFHLTCSITKPELLEATAIPADFVHSLMENSYSKQQVIVLDCCFSGAFAKGMAVKGEAVNLARQLGGQGRAVLTSSSATEYSFEQKEVDLSVYTRYWVEGIQTGAADEDGNGWISVDELHSYTSRKVQESAPAMKPRIYAAEEGYKILLAKAPVGDPRLEYRKEVERLAQERKGKFSKILLAGLDEKRMRLALSLEMAETIQAEVLRPYWELDRKLKQYEQAVRSALQQEWVLSQTTRSDLQYLQKILGLRDTDVSSINDRIPHSRRLLQPQKEQLQFQTKPSLTQKTLRWLMLLGGSVLIALGVVFGSQLFIELSSSMVDNLSSTLSLSIIYKRGLLSLGDSRYESGDYQGAIDYYTNVLTIDQNYAEAYLRRGIAKSDLNDKQGAITDYTEAIRLDQNYAEAYLRRGIAKSDLNDKQEAITDYTEAIRLAQNYAEAYLRRGVAKSDLNDKQGAITDYTEAIRLRQDYAEAYLSRGVAKSDLKDNQGAIADYTEAIRFRQDYAEAYHYRGIAKFDAGKKDEAIADYDEAIALKSSYADAYHNRGVANSVRGEKEKAISDYRKAAGFYQQQGNVERCQDTLKVIKDLENRGKGLLERLLNSAPIDCGT